MPMRPEDRDRSAERPPTPVPAAKRRRVTQRESVGEAAIKSVLRSIASSLGRAIAKMLTGSRR